MTSLEEWRQKLKLNEDMRLFDQKAREAFHQQPEEKKAKSLAAKSFILYPFEVHYNQAKSFEEKEAEAMFIIEEHLKTHKKCFVSTSMGMDSTMLHHMVMRAAKNVGVTNVEYWLNNTLNIYKEEPAYWNQINELFGTKDQFRVFTPPKDEDGRQQTVWSIAKRFNHLPHFRSLRGNRTGKVKKKEKNTANDGQTPECCDILKKESLKGFLKSLPKEDRYDCHFVGTRAEESRIRKIGVMQRCRSYIIKNHWAYPIRAVTPLSYMTRNVWKRHQCHPEEVTTEIIEHKNYCVCGHLEDEHLFIPNDDIGDDITNCEECKCKKYKNNYVEKIHTGKFITETKWIPNEGETKPEDDIDTYYKKYNIPKNPTYEIHNLTRMGCASCPAHKNWEIRLATDPTQEGQGMLKQNLLILKKTQPVRYQESISLLKKNKLVPLLIAEIEKTPLLTDFFEVTP